MVNRKITPHWMKRKGKRVWKELTWHEGSNLVKIAIEGPKAESNPPGTEEEPCDVYPVRSR